MLNGQKPLKIAEENNFIFLQVQVQLKQIKKTFMKMGPIYLRMEMFILEIIYIKLL